ncbi:MAG: hypothetical protein WKF80_00220 [Thermomicrobiales bacterium]
MDNPFSWDYQTTVPGPDDVFGPFSTAYLILFAIGLVASIVVYNDGARRFFRNGLQRRFAQRASGYAMIIFGMGLFFFLIRWLQINPFTFGARIWLYLSFLSLIGFALAVANYLRTDYPAEREAYESRKTRQHYLKTHPSGSRPNAIRAVPVGRRPVRRRLRR